MDERVLLDRCHPPLSAGPKENSVPLNMAPSLAPLPSHPEGLVLSIEAHVVLDGMSCRNNTESWGQRGDGKRDVSETGGGARLGTL